MDEEPAVEVASWDGGTVETANNNKSSNMIVDQTFGMINNSSASAGGAGMNSTTSELIAEIEAAEKEEVADGTDCEKIIIAIQEEEENHNLEEQHKAQSCKGS